MRRKYDIRNKRTFVIILILSIAIIGIFSLFIYKYKHTGSIEYKISTGSILQDNNKNYLELEEDGILKVRWNGNYYLMYQDKKIGLGKKVIVYNKLTKGLNLYGKFYEITESGKIINHSDVDLKNTANTKFYKLDDREYLLVDKEITSGDKSINASDYLLVELDRMGNAKLSNYKLNLKTIKPTTLFTSKYSFDIANELLKYNDLEIDLKKIIGTTNQYKKEEDEDKNKDKEDNQDEQTVITQVTANGAGGDTNVVNNNNLNGKTVTIEELLRSVKMTSIIRATESLSTIDVYYVIYDPYNEYRSVYAVIHKNGEEINVPLSKTENHVSFEGLNADKDYLIEFFYTTIDSETNKTALTSFGKLDMHTLKPQYRIQVYSISGVSNELWFKLYLQENYPISNAYVTVEIDCDGCNYEPIKKTVTNIDDYSLVVRDAVSLKGYVLGNNTTFRLTVDSVDGPDGNIEIGNSATFKLGR